MAPGIFNLFAYANEGHAEPQELDRNAIRPNHAFVDRGDGRSPITVLGIDLRVQSPVLPELLKVFCFHACWVLISYARVPSSICGSREGPIWQQFYWTNSTRLRLLFEFLNPSLSSLRLFDGSVQLPFGVDPPLANSPDNSKQADDGQQVNCNHFLRLLSNLFCSLRTSTQSSCRIHFGRDSRVS